MVALRRLAGFGRRDLAIDFGWNASSVRVIELLRLARIDLRGLLVLVGVGILVAH